MSTDKLTAIDRLEAMLNERDEELAELRAEKQAREDEEHFGWTRHLKPPESDLPVPRLELRWTAIGEPGWTWLARYCLVYRHFLGHLVAVPLGETRRGGADGRAPIDRDGRVETPFRDGAHLACDAATLGLPAFAVYGDTATRIEPRPPTTQRRGEDPR